MSVNLQARPRIWSGKDLSPFDTLRALADTDLVRIAIQDVKGQVEGMGYDVVTAEDDHDEITPELQKQIAAAKAWVKRPDPAGNRSYRQCLSSWLEELLVTDALTLYPFTDRAKRPLGLMQIDGATIFPIVDDLGRPPLPPAVAFQQIVHGLVETEFTTQDLWYRPRNTRPDCPYGRSPTEMVLITVNLAIRSQLSDLSYYTDGSIPEGIYSIPDMSMEALADVQRDFDATLSGNDSTRHSLRMLPPGVYQALKDRQWSYEFQEWLARVIAWAFGVSPMPIAKQMNRSTGESMESSSMESGVRPIAEWLAEIVTDYIQGPLGFPDLKFVFGDDETEDPTVVFTRNTSYWKSGGLTFNEFLKATGSKPVKGPLGEERFWETAAGPVRMSDVIQQAEDAAAARAKALEAPTESEAPDTTARAQGAPDDSGAGKDQALEDLKRWCTFTLKRQGSGRPLRKFASATIPAPLARAVQAALEAIPDDAAPEEARRQVRAIFDCASLRRRMEKDPPAALAKPASRIAKLVAAWVKEHRDAIIEAAVAELPAAKAARRIDKIASSGLAKLAADLFDMDDMHDPMSKQIARSLLAGATETTAITGFTFDNLPEEALAYANERAAELVGKKWVAGILVDNPNPRWAINETIREAVQDKVATAVEKGWSPQKLTSELKTILDPARGETVARTETGLAYQEGALKIYEAGGQVYVEIVDGFGCLPTGHDNEAPPADTAEKGLQLESQADGQTWTLAELRDHRLGHPNCVRGAIPAEE